MLCAVKRAWMSLDAGWTRGMAGWRRGVLIAGRARHIKSRCHFQWSGHGKKQHTHRQHFMMYGMVAFMWERERITNEDVMSCLKEYVERVSNNLSISTAAQGDTERRTNQPPPPSATDPHYSTPDVAHQGLLNWLYSSDTSTKPDHITSTELPPASFPWSYLTWAQSVLTWSTHAENNTNTTNNFITEHEEYSDTNLSDVTESPVDTQRRKREEFANECFRYYQAHSKERISQLPLVGMPGSKRQLSQVLRVLEGLEEKTRGVVLNVLSSQRSKVNPRSEFTDVRLEDDLSLVSALSDLACIGGFSDMEPNHALPALHSEGWVKCYMQLELVEDDNLNASATRQSTGVWEGNNRFNLLVQRVQPFLEHARSLLLSSQNYLASQFLLEEAFSLEQVISLDGMGIEPLVDRVRSFAVSSHKYFCSQLLMDGGFDVDEASCLLDNGVSYVGSRDVCSTATEELTGVSRSNDVTQVITRTPPPIDKSGYHHHHHHHQVFGFNWEFVTNDRNYTVYRRYYKDTGLFQYKVIGHYDDITAKDFFEAQVDRECRKSWDVYAGDMVIVDTDHQSDCKLVHWVMKYPFPMSNREYLFVEKSWISADDDVIVVMKRSALHPDYPDQGKCVRVTDYFSDMVIKSRSTIQELGMDFELTYFDNPKTNLPSSCTNWVASTAMPDYMSKIHSAALKRQA